ncbi:MAG: peptidoglycan DD-metalloendopeptidase family protein [Clostridia bacterium]|nr:peptidoglycan DD-metalloendopeptidase family protein [Clostridia bacterium]
MEKLIDAVYAAVAFLGNLPKSIFSAVFSFIGRLLTKVLERIRKFNKKSFSSHKVFARRAIICVIVIAVICSATVIGLHNSLKISATALKVDGRVIGYAATPEDADLAKALAIESLGSNGYKPVENADTRTEASNVKNAETLAAAIVDTFKKDLTPVSEVYVNGALLCAVEDGQGAREAIAEAFANANKVYPTSAVSFAESVTIKPAYYTDDKPTITVDKLKGLLAKSDTLQIRHAECKQDVTIKTYETVEIQTNQLFLGDSRIKRSGQNGAEYKISLVTSIGDKEQLSEQRMSVPIKEPVPQIIEKGIRAESLVMETYTVMQTLGVFVWPAVDLYEVTSPFGIRSLGNHKGIDISGKNASGCLVVAGASGVVTEAGYNSGGYGNYVKINHGNGIETLYAHMLDNSLAVSAGDIVQKGQVVGQVGNTGYSFGAHLHFEVRINGVKVDPAPYLGLEPGQKGMVR